MFVLGSSILIGMMAQMGKGRTGVFWGGAGFFVWWVIYFLTIYATMDMPTDDTTNMARDFTASLVTVGLFAILILTLPNPKKE